MLYNNDNLCLYTSLSAAGQSKPCAAEGVSKARVLRGVAGPVLKLKLLPGAVAIVLFALRVAPRQLDLFPVLAALRLKVKV